MPCANTHGTHNFCCCQADPGLNYAECWHYSTWRWHSGFLNFLKCWDWILAYASLCMHVCMYVCVYSMYVCMYVCMYLCMDGLMNVCVYLCMDGCMYVASFPGLFRFCSSVCVQYNTWKRKSGEKWGSPGNTYRMTWMWDGCKGGGGAQLQIHAQ